MSATAKAAVLAIVITACTIGFASPVRAACGVGNNSAPHGFTTPLANRTGYHPASFVSVADSDAPSIVGLWEIAFTAKDMPGIPDGTVLDAGYATWHADGTELMNSGRPPITSSFCMGVWKQVGRSTYRLNHVALSWDDSGANFVGPANIKEQVTVDRTGDTYRGTFSIDQFDISGNLVGHATGIVTGRRITVN